MKKISLITLLFFTIIACKKDVDDEMQIVTSTFCTVNNPIHQKVVLLVLGQSNAANAGGELFFSDCNRTFNFYQGGLYPLKDPLKGANGEGGSVWSRLAVKLMEYNFADTIVIAPAAIGGTAIEQWIPGGDLDYLITETVESLHASNLEVTYVLWHQGESNNTALNTNVSAQQNAQNYADNFILLVQYLRSINVYAPVFIAQTSRCATMQSDNFLLQVQANLASDSLGIYLGPNTDNLGNEYRYDDCHFNGEGLDKHAQMWADSLLNY